jgi:hypothetical protein
MKMKHSKLSIATVFTIIASFVLLLALPATTLADNECRLDQRQLQHPAAILFGGRTVLGQTFIPSAPGHHLCQVKVMIQKNVAAAGNLTLHILRSNFTELDAGVTIPGGPIPMGNSVQVFDFGCNGAVLAGMPFYGLKLESPNSPVGAYSWQGSAGNLYARPGADVRGWRNLNGGKGKWNSLGGWDYAFEIYMCN